MESGQIVPNLLVMLVTFFFAAFFVACEFALGRIYNSSATN